MKNTKTFAVVFFVAAIISVSLFCSKVCAQTAAPSGQSAFEQSSDWNKLDSTLQQAWLDAKKAKDMSRRFDCFVRGEDAYDRGDKSFLESKGFNVRIMSGRVASGNVAADDLPYVAALPFVRKISSASSN